MRVLESVGCVPIGTTHHQDEPADTITLLVLEMHNPGSPHTLFNIPFPYPKFRAPELHKFMYSEDGRRDPSRWPRGTLYPQKLAITSPTSGGRSVGMVRSRTQTMEFFYVFWGAVRMTGDSVTDEEKEPCFTYLPKLNALQFRSRPYQNKCQKKSAAWFWSYTILLLFHNSGARNWGTMLQAGTSWVWFSMRTLDSSIYLILSAALWPWGLLSL
jgi:hypothetical protein